MAAKRGRSERLAVYLDGERAFDLSLQVVDQAGVRQGDLLDEERQAWLLEQDAPHRAKDKALDFLAMRERCAREVEEKLVAAGFEGEVAGSTVSWLRDLGYVDDCRFATTFVESRLRSGWGARRIRSELLRKGADREAVEKALQQAAAQEDSGSEGMVAVMTLARRRFGGQFASDPTGARRRLAGFLARRGYDWETIGDITRTLEQESAAGAG